MAVLRTNGRLRFLQPSMEVVTHVFYFISLVSCLQVSPFVSLLSRQAIVILVYAVQTDKVILAVDTLDLSNLEKLPRVSIAVTWDGILRDDDDVTLSQTRKQTFS